MGYNDRYGTYTVPSQPNGQVGLFDVVRGAGPAFSALGKGAHALFGTATHGTGPGPSALWSNSASNAAGPQAASNGSIAGVGAAGAADAAGADTSAGFSSAAVDSMAGSTAATTGSTVGGVGGGVGGAGVMAGIGGAAGGIGAGMAAGSLTSYLAGHYGSSDSQTGTMVGTAVGTAVGFFFPEFGGPMVGGLVGGALGGLFKDGGIVDPRHHNANAQQKPVKRASGGALSPEGQGVGLFHSPQGPMPTTMGALPNVYGRLDGPGDGRSDSIQALLSRGEFVIPADVVGALGQGDNDAGADRLDQFVTQMRHHQVQKLGALPAPKK